MGANNVTRALGMTWGGLVWAIDSGKGVVAVLVSQLIMPWDVISASVIGAIAVVVGHNWSLIAALVTGTLRGGKGAATAGGTWVIMMAPWWYIDHADAVGLDRADHTLRIAGVVTWVVISW
jgi:glycerol-3-phosphate acyltransferase PlsY